MTLGGGTLAEDRDSSSRIGEDALIRSLALNRDTPHALLLGSGCSVTSGIPTADGCIWLWKRDIFVSNNVELGTQFSDISLESTRTRIHQWIDNQGGYPGAGDPAEYSFFAEACYPREPDRTKFFRDCAERAHPHTGYQYLALLAEGRLFTSIWTTNFDGLVARALSTADATPFEVGLDTSRRLDMPRGPKDVLIVALHGDYRYDALKNTDAELREQDDDLRAALVDSLVDTTLVVCGYSGRDDSVMEALSAAYSRPGSGGLFWCQQSDGDPDERVRALLDRAKASGRNASLVPRVSFDELMQGVALRVLDEHLHSRALELQRTAAASADGAPPALGLPSGAVNLLLKSNAFRVDCPKEVLQFEIEDAPPGVKPWAFLREQIGSRNLVGGFLRGKVLALGDAEEVAAAFADVLRSPIERSPLGANELARTDGVVTSLFAGALTRAMAAQHDLHTDNRRLLWRRGRSTSETVSGQAYDVHDAVLLYLRRYGAHDHVLLKPTVAAFDSAGEPASQEVSKEIKRRLLTHQYNKQFNAALETWRNMLLPDKRNVLPFPNGSVAPFEFAVSRFPKWATISARGRPPVPVPKSISNYSPQRGIEFEDPPLIFAAKSGGGIARDPLPVRGIVENRPYDHVLTKHGLAPEISLGVICPSPQANALASYLQGLRQPHTTDTKQEYLVTYPGFERAYGVPIHIPGPNDAEWVASEGPKAGVDIRRGAAELRAEMSRCIEQLQSSRKATVVLVHIPRSWQRWEHYEAGEERFDLHDFVKAYCAQRGIASQFLREDTLTKQHQGEVVWWLSLSLFTKAMRTPWILDGLDPEVAFMGLGFSVQPKRSSGGHVVVGCSHLYSSEGRGLQYRLSRLEDPIVRNRNPFMSRDDARRMAERARELFVETTGLLPKRVVIHKRTPFSWDERKGLCEGLSGVDAVDMLEVTVDDALRYVAADARGKAPAAFPVRRGSCVLLDKSRALLWVHGTADALRPGQHYYQGKSRIPAPLMVKRHHGSSELSVIAKEILGLSKMDWNTFDLYSKLPATIKSSNTIARIGALLERFGSASYDYRLFM